MKGRESRVPTSKGGDRKWRERRNEGRKAERKGEGREIKTCSALPMKKSFPRACMLPIILDFFLCFSI